MVDSLTDLLTTGFLIIIFSTSQVVSQCSRQDYQRCVKLADPLLKDPHLIYPDNPQDIDNVCRTWTYFVECVKSYTDRCFSEARRREFNKAVETPVSSIHQLCSMPDYRDDYLKHATCMKMTLTQDKHCGRHYRLLVSQVSGDAGSTSVCCSHHMLRECVVDQAKITCDPKSAPYSASMLDKALSFLREQCSNFIPTQFDCPGSDFYKSTPASRAETDRRQMDQMPVVNTRPTFPDRDTSGPRTTMGSTVPQPAMTSSSSMFTSTTLDSRGSGTSLHPSMPSSPSTRSEPDPWTPTMTTAQEESERTSFARGMTWRPVGNAPPTSPGTYKVSSSEFWMPSSRPPAMIDNAIDEPNQQGLESEKRNSSAKSTPGLVVFICTVLTITASLIR